MWILYLFLVGIVFLGLFTSYTDIKYGKIWNKTIIITLVYSFVIYIIYFLSLNPGDFIGYLNQTTINFIFALLVGYLMWDVGLWTAGDGKLFTTYALLVPVFVYSPASYISFFPSMNILINTFVPVFLFFILVLLFKTSWTAKRISFRRAFNPKKVLFLILSLFVFLWIIDIVSSFIGVSLNYFFYIIILSMVILPFEKLFSNNFNLFVAFLGVLRFFLDKSIFTIYFVKTFVFFILMFLVLRYFILELGFIRFTTSVPINNLVEGMVPAELIYKQENEYIRTKMLFFSFLGYIRHTNSIFDMKSEGLSCKDILKIKKLAKKHDDFKTFQIQQTLPFAIFLFLGVVITLIARGNIFIFLRFIFG